MPLQLIRTTGDLLRRMDAHLRTGAEPLAVRTHVRGELGPQAYRHAHFSADDFFHPDPRAGIVRTVYGQRVLMASGAFLAAWTETLVQAAGPNAMDILYRAGCNWGDADFAACRSRLEYEYGVPLSSLDIALVLESWWWPFRAGGWGRWRCDLGHPQSGIVLIDVTASAVSAALGRTGYCECHLYAGLFAGAFSRFTTHSLAAIEFACASRGDERCRFLVAGPAKVERARSWRDGGLGADETLRRITTMGGRQ